MPCVSHVVVHLTMIIIFYRCLFVIIIIIIISTVYLMLHLIQL